MRYLLPIFLFIGCHKPAELVHLQIADAGDKLFYSFTYQGGQYDPQDSTVVVSDAYKFTLPANEPTGYIKPLWYVSKPGVIVIKSAINSLLKLSY